MNISLPRKEKVTTLMTVFNGVFETSYFAASPSRVVVHEHAMVMAFSQACVRIHGEGGERYK